MKDSKPKSKVGRREFLTGAAAASATALTGCAGPSDDTAPAVQTRKRVTWRLASSFPRALDTIFGGAEVLAKRVAKLSGDRFQIRAYPAGELVPAFQVLDAVQQGTVQAGHTASYYYIGKNPSVAFDTAIPFGLTARQQIAWLYHGGGLDLVREVFADFNAISFPCGNTGTQMGGWFRREIFGASDLPGLKMRIPGIGGQVMDRLGVTVQAIPGGEIYPALERGVIDASEWVGPYDDEKLGFFKVAKYYYYPGWWEPGPNLSLLVNLDAWDALSTEYKDILEVAAYEANVNMLARYDSLNPQALERLVGSGVQLRRFSDEILEVSREAAVDLIEEHAAQDAGYRKIYESFKKAQTQAYRYFSTTEQAFADFVYKS